MPGPCDVTTEIAQGLHVSASDVRHSLGGRRRQMHPPQALLPIVLEGDWLCPLFNYATAKLLARGDDSAVADFIPKLDNLTGHVRQAELVGYQNLRRK